MKPMTEKQAKFIENLMFRKQAQPGGEGILLDTGFYDELPLGRALDGEASSAEASRIISFLMDQPDKVSSDHITPRQASYIRSLAQKAGRTIDFTDMTKTQASELIEELKTELATNA